MTAHANTKNPRRVAAGQLNGVKRRPWKEEDRLRLAVQCRERRPWLGSTGPRTLQGKLRAAANGRKRRPDPQSLRQARAEFAAVRRMVKQMAPFHRAIRAVVAGEPQR